MADRVHQPGGAAEEESELVLRGQNADELRALNWISLPENGREDVNKLLTASEIEAMQPHSQPKSLASYGGIANARPTAHVEPSDNSLANRFFRGQSVAGIVCWQPLSAAALRLF